MGAPIITGALGQGAWVTKPSTTLPSSLTSNKRERDMSLWQCVQMSDERHRAAKDYMRPAEFATSDEHAVANSHARLE